MHTPGGEKQKEMTQTQSGQNGEQWQGTKKIIFFYVLTISAIGFGLVIESWIWKLKSIEKKENGKPVLYNYQENYMEVSLKSLVFEGNPMYCKALFKRFFTLLIQVYCI